MVADPRGFLKIRRADAPKRPVEERRRDWRVVIEPVPEDHCAAQASRCMDCGVAFCHGGCPLGNDIPRWNELVARGQWREAIGSLHGTNNFPEFTGWLCPAPCEPACVLNLGDEPVTIKTIERSIIERAWAEDWVEPVTTEARSGAAVAVIGSGPAGLAAAQQLSRIGHVVTVFERDDRLGGLLRYGIPDFKMDKALIDRRIAQMTAEGTVFRTGVEVGVDVPAVELLDSFDAIVLACGAPAPRELTVPGRQLQGVHQAMEYLPLANRVQAGDLDRSPIDARGRRVVIIGGGDTGADCLGTANRQGAVCVHQLDHNPCPPEERDELTNPWPQWPRTHKHAPAHEEGVEEERAAEVTELVDDGHGAVGAVRGQRVLRHVIAGRRHLEPLPGTEFELAADLVLLSCGFAGAERSSLLDRLGVQLDPCTGRVRVDDDYATTGARVWSCGDQTRGASLVVWAIAEGRSCAAAVDAALCGEQRLPAPIRPSDGPLCEP
jgi:glutamate synthase (NADPH) small chain